MNYKETIAKLKQDTARIRQIREEMDRELAKPQQNEDKVAIKMTARPETK